MRRRRSLTDVTGLDSMIYDSKSEVVMRRKVTATLLGLLLAAGATACGPDDDNGNDTGMQTDTGGDDTGMADTGTADTGMEDGGMTDGGMTDGGDTGPEGPLGTALGELQNPQNEGGMSSMGGSSPSVEGYAVTAAEVDGEGRTDITGMQAMTDAEGNFSLKVDVSAEAEGEARTVSDFVVQAQKDDGPTSEVIVSQELTADEEVKTEPITVESSVESDAYVEARVSGEWQAEGGGNGGSEPCMGCTTANLRSMIDAETAAMIDASQDYQADLEAESKAVVSGMKGWAKGLMDNAGAAEADIEAALQAQTEARATLSAALYDAESSSEVDSAWETYSQAVVSAYTDNNITAEHLAVGAQSAAEAMLHFQSDLSAQAEQRAKAAAELWRAQKVRASVEAKINAMAEASMDQKTQVESAGDALETKLRNAGEASSDFQAKIEQAWEDYESSVRTQFMAALEAEADGNVVTDFSAMIESAVIAELETVKSTYQGALDFGSDVSTTAAAAASVQAFAQLWSTTTGEASMKMLTEVEVGGQTEATGISSESAGAALEAMAHVSAAASGSAGTN